MAYPFSYYQPNNPYSAPAPAPAYPVAPAPQTQHNPGGFTCRPVTSKAEAEVYQIPFDGSTTYFVDTSNGHIYAKSFDFNTGTAPVITFTRENVKPVQYATIDDLNALRAELRGGNHNDAANGSD